MADSNNYRAGNMPKTPNPALKKLDRLIGTWQQSGGYKGTGFDEDTQTLRSHLIGIDGSNFTYTWVVL